MHQNKLLSFSVLTFLSLSSLATDATDSSANELLAKMGSNDNTISEETTKLLDLPEEILLAIFKELPEADRLNLAAACKQLNRISNSVVNPKKFFFALKCLDKDTLISMLDIEHNHVHIQDNNKQTPLHISACKGELELVSLLIEYDANVNVKDNKGQTPLHINARNRNNDLELIKLLIQRGADVNEQDNQGQRLFHIIAETGNFQLGINLIEWIIKTKEVLGKFTDFNVQDAKGMTPIELADNNIADSGSKTFFINILEDLHKYINNPTTKKFRIRRAPQFKPSSL